MAGVVLVVEDEPLTRRILAIGLHKAGFEVHEAAGAAQCRRIVRSRRIDVAVVDLGLPDADGLELAAELRRQGDMGLIVVTRRSAPEARIEALDVGADDYLVKPAHLGELAARIRSVLRRRAHKRTRTWRIGGWRVDLDARKVCCGDEPVRLTRGEFDILEALITAEGSVVDRADLLALISRAPEAADPRSVDVLVSRLRRKIGADGGSIVTVGGRGYQLEEPAQAA